MFVKNKLIFKKVALFFLIVLALDFIAGESLYFLYSKAKYGVSAQEYYSLIESKEDLLIFGSSRAAYHYDPDIFSKSTGLKAYNLGREGLGIHYHHALLTGIVNRYKPKMAVLDLSYSDIYRSSSNFNENDLKELWPFYHKISDEFDSLIVFDDYDNIFIQSKSLRYNKKFIRILSGNLFTLRDHSGGFRPLLGETKKTFSPYYVEQEIDAFKLSKLQGFINICKENDIRLLIVASPFYASFKKDISDPIRDIASKNRIQFIDYLQKEDYIKNNSYFYDKGHLNSEGAAKFSSEIAALLSNSE